MSGGARDPVKRLCMRYIAPMAGVGHRGGSLPIWIWTCIGFRKGSPKFVPSQGGKGKKRRKSNGTEENTLMLVESGGNAKTE